MKKLSIILFILTAMFFSAQEKQNKNHFTVIKKANGDLNRDGLDDKVLLSIDTIDNNRPLKLQIFLLGPDRKFKSHFSSTEVFDSQYPNGKYGGNQVPDISIMKNDLVIYLEINDVKQDQTFRFNKGKFELIYVSKVKWDGKETTVETQIDLLKGTITEITQILGSKKSKKNQKKITVNSLPLLDQRLSIDQQFN